MDTVTRRRFLIASGVTGGAAWPPAPARHLASRPPPRPADPLPADAKILVLVTLYGGNDGINTVVPYADPAYHDAGRSSPTPRARCCVSTAVGLNPAMKGCSRSGRRRLAVVRGVGYPKPDHSHFRSMDIWQTALPRRARRHGLDRPVAGRDRRRPGARGASARAAAARRRRERPPPRSRWAAGAGRAERPGVGWEPPTRPTRRARRWRPGLPAAAVRDATFGPCWSPTVVRDGPTIRRRRAHRPAGRRTPGAARRRRAVHQGRRPDVGIRGEPWRIRHPCRREGHPAEATRRVGLGGQRLPRGHDRRSPRSRCVVVDLLRIRPPGRRRTPRRAPTTARPARCSSPGTRSKAGSTATSRQPDRAGRRRPQGHDRLPDVYGELLDKVLDTEACRVLDGTRPTLDFL